MRIPWKSLVRRIALPACLFTLILASRWAFIGAYGSDLPVWDQWDAEGLHLLSPWKSGHLSLSELFLPHNEHRVVLTKLLNLAVTAANRQWDQRLEATVNAFLPAAVALALFLFGRNFCERKGRAALFVFIAATFSLPYAWENVTAGFHSQQLFLIGSALGALLCLVGARAGSGRWFLGCLFLALGLVSMASGLVAALVVIGILFLRLLKGQASLRSVLPSFAIGLVVAIVGWKSQVTVDYHAVLKAHSFSDFALTAIKALQWPTDGMAWAWLSIILWLPWAILAVRLLAASNRETDRGWALLGLGGWVILQILATAYARGSGGPGPASRYIDTLVFGAAINALSLGWLALQLPKGGGRRPDFGCVASAWAVVFAVGSILQLHHIYSAELPSQPLENFYEQQNTRNYIATGDFAYLQHLEIPYPDPGSITLRLALPGLRELMPASVRAPLPLESAAPSPFVTWDGRGPQSKRVPAGPISGYSPATPTIPNRVTHGSFGTQGAATVGEWRSKPVRSEVGGWLRFEVAGQLGEAGVSLELLDAATGKALATVRRDGVPGDSWHAAYVRTPPSTFVVRAADQDPSRWIAFTDPVEMGALSHLAWQVTKNAFWILGIAAAAAFGLGLLALREESAR